MAGVSPVPLLTPVALTELVQKIPYGPKMILSNKARKVPNPLDYVAWDVYRPNHGAGNFNYRGGEAEVVDQVGRSNMSAQLAYLRMKKIFTPETLYFLRELGGLGVQNAAQAIAREVENLNERIDNRVEITLWGAIGGTASLPYADGTTKTVDYGFDSTHKVTLSGAANVWATASYQTIIAQIRAAKYVVETDGSVDVTEAFLTAKTMDKLFDAAARPALIDPTSAPSASNPVGSFGGGLLSDRMKESYYQSGTLPGFMGMNWTVVAVSNLYDNASGVRTPVVADDKVYFTNLTDGNPLELREGVTADLSNTQGAIGKFSKSWKQEDPSAEQFLIEYSFLPVVTRPEQFYVLTVA